MDKYQHSRFGGGVVEMYDLDDAEAFVWDVIFKQVRVIPRDNRQVLEEMVAEGLLILCMLYERYDPVKDKESKTRARANGDVHVCKDARCCVPSFAAYAKFILPKKLNEVWFSRQPEYHIKTVEGKKTYVRLQSAVSIDERDQQAFERTGVTNGKPNSILDMETTRRVTQFTCVPVVPRGENDG